jgi:hypothetical protein
MKLLSLKKTLLCVLFGASLATQSHAYTVKSFDIEFNTSFRADISFISDLIVDLADNGALEGLGTAGEALQLLTQVNNLENFELVGTGTGHAYLDDTGRFTFSVPQMTTTETLVTGTGFSGLLLPDLLFETAFDIAGSFNGIISGSSLYVPFLGGDSVTISNCNDTGSVGLFPPVVPVPICGAIGSVLPLEIPLFMAPVEIGLNSGDQTFIGFEEIELLDQLSLGYNMKITAVPVPAALWLFGSALIGLIGVKRRARA